MQVGDLIKFTKTGATGILVSSTNNKAGNIYWKVWGGLSPLDLGARSAPPGRVTLYKSMFTTFSQERLTMSDVEMLNASR